MLLVLTTAGSAFAASLEQFDEAERQFQAWILDTVWPAVQTAGVTRAVFDAAFDGVTLDWTLPELKTPDGGAFGSHAEAQTEFRDPSSYFNEKEIAHLVADGRAAETEWAPVLAAVEAKYGVPGAIVLAIWGRETAFGSVLPNRHAIRTLATEAFIGVRAATFFPELVAALTILERSSMAPAEMMSSWAGALGQPQFMPSRFFENAVDFDGDGRADIWNSIPDVLGSIANYLVAFDWQRGLPWGFEVAVPDSVSCTLEGPGKPLREWQKLGLAPAAGGLPAGATSDTLAYLLMPAGRFGPAFLVTSNFRVIESYNESDLYALFVGYVADRITDDRPFVGKWADIAGDFTRGDVQVMQERLISQGYDLGAADGLVGVRTRVAIGEWQQAAGKPATCFPDADLLASLK